MFHCSVINVLCCFATAFIFYHITFGLSRTFLTFLKKFFHSCFPASSFVILPCLFFFVKNFFKIFIFIDCSQTQLRQNIISFQICQPSFWFFLKIYFFFCHCRTSCLTQLRYNSIPFSICQHFFHFFAIPVTIQPWEYFVFYFIRRLAESHRQKQFIANGCLLNPALYLYISLSYCLLGAFLYIQVCYTPTVSHFTPFPPPFGCFPLYPSMLHPHSFSFHTLSTPYLRKVVFVLWIFVK